MCTPPTYVGACSHLDRLLVSPRSRLTDPLCTMVWDSAPSGSYSLFLVTQKMLPHRLFPREICWSKTEIQKPSQARINYDIKSSPERDQASGWLCEVFDYLPPCRPLKLNEVKILSQLLEALSPSGRASIRQLRSSSMSLPGKVGRNPQAPDGPSNALVTQPGQRTEETGSVTVLGTSTYHWGMFRGLSPTQGRSKNQESEDFRFHLRQV